MREHGFKARFHDLLILLMLAVALCFQISARPAADNAPGAWPVKIIAHRGVNKFAPPNTIPAIELAIKMKLDYVECDVRQTSDGEMVLMHNSSVDATTDGKGDVKDLTLADIKKLDAGIRVKPKFKGTRVPTFREALQAMKGKIGAYIDFKAGDTDKLVAIIEECGMVDDVVLYAGMNEMLASQRLNSRIRVMPGVDNVQQLQLLEKTMKFEVIETSIGLATKELVDAAHARGIMVYMDILGLADNKNGLEDALKLGVDAIQTDNPDVIIKYFKKHGQNNSQ